MAMGYYCKDCESPICSDCAMFGNHKGTTDLCYHSRCKVCPADCPPYWTVGHSCTKLDEVVNRLKEDLGVGVNALSQCKQKLMGMAQIAEADLDAVLSPTSCVPVVALYLWPKISLAGATEKESGP